MKKIAELAIDEEYKTNDGLNEFFNIINTDEVINFYCVNCETTMSFKQKDKHLIVDGIIGDVNSYKFHTISFQKGEIKYKEGEYSSEEKVIKVNDNTRYYFLISFVCPQKSCYTNIIQIFYFSDNSIKKVYQNYEDETINPKYLGELSRQRYLSKQDINELFKADQLHKKGYHIASYVYLRRVLENIFIRLYEENKIDITDDNTSFEKKYTRDKIKLINSYLPELENSTESDNKYLQLYKILSEGIHKLDENTAAKYYKLIKQVIIMILEKIRDNEEKEKNVCKITNTFDDIFNKNK